MLFVSMENLGMGNLLSYKGSYMSCHLI